MVTNTQTYTLDLQDGTLDELRRFVADTEGMPGVAKVTVRTGFGGGNRHGSRIKALAAEVTVTRQGESP